MPVIARAMMTRAAMTRAVIVCLLAPALAACAPGRGDRAMYLIDPPAPADRVPDRLGRIELREVVLPQYAAGQEMLRQDGTGALRGDLAAVWADAPGRGLTQALATQISHVSGATALAQPWPLATPPDRVLEIRIDRIFAGHDGAFHLSGQYFIAPRDAGRDIVRGFDISEPIKPAPAAGAAPTAAAVAAAQAGALQALARQIAQLR